MLSLLLPDPQDQGNPLLWNASTVKKHLGKGCRAIDRSSEFYRRCVVLVFGALL